MSVRPHVWLATVATLCACSSSVSSPPTGPGADASTPTDTQTPTDVVATPDAVAPDDVATPDAVTTPDAVAPSDAIAIALEHRAVAVPLQMIAPGQEITMCREVRLGNADAMLVRAIHVSIPRGSHHVIVYRSHATTEQLTLTPCQGLSGILEGTAPIFIAQQPESGIDFPSGVGLSIAANQMIRLEEHFINTTTAPLMVGANVTFELAHAEGLIPADLMFWGTQNISVAPHAMGTAQYFHAAPSNVNVFGLTSHTHEHGVLATIELATSLTGVGRELHRNTNWAEPPLTRFDPPQVFAPGEGLRLVCHYNNTGDTALRFGESFFQEMCFLWAYYYPSVGFHVCFDGLCRALPL